MNINLKTASSLLAKAQGGMVVKGVIQKKLSRTVVESIFGKDVPAFACVGGLRVSIQPDGEDFRLFVRRGVNA